MLENFLQYQRCHVYIINSTFDTADKYFIDTLTIATNTLQPPHGDSVNITHTVGWTFGRKTFK